MRIDIIPVLPELLESPFSHSIMKRAKDKGLLEVYAHNLRDTTPYKQGQVDDYQFGGGAGMVMMPEPLAVAIELLQKDRKYDEIIYMTPDGPLFDQKTANTLSLKENIMIICGHYKGIDDRIRQLYVTKEISIGDFVLSGGEIAALALIDACVRQLPGALNDDASAVEDSFVSGLLDCAHYTRPEEYEGMRVPDVLLSGNHELIRRWRLKQALGRTWLRRPDLLGQRGLSSEETQLLEEFKRERQ